MSRITERKKISKAAKEIFNHQELLRVIGKTFSLSKKIEKRKISVIQPEEVARVLDNLAETLPIVINEIFAIHYGSTPEQIQSDVDDLTKCINREKGISPFTSPEPGRTLKLMFSLIMLKLEKLVKNLLLAADRDYLFYLLCKDYL